MLLVYVCRPFILNVVFGKIEADVSYNANLYLMIVAASIPMISLYNAGAAIFRMMGDSKTAMFMSLFMNGINITGNAILLYGLKWGVEGAAIPTLVSRMIAGVVMIALLFNQKKVLHLSRPIVVKFQWPVLKKILHIGVPNGLENSMFQLGKIMVLSLVSTFGTYAIAANAVSNAVALFQILPGIALNLAITSVIAMCVGAGDYEQAHYYTKKLVGIVYVLIWIMNAVIFLLLPFILKAYHLSDLTAETTKQILYFHSISCMIVWPIAFSLPATLRAAGDAKVTMIISIASMWIFRIVFSYILGRYMGLGVFGVWVAMVIDWCFRAVFMMVRYHGGKWKLMRSI